MSKPAIIAEGLGKEIEKVTVKFEVSKAKNDIVHPHGVVRKGMVGGQHYEWTAWVEGAPLIVCGKNVPSPTIRTEPLTRTA